MSCPLGSGRLEVEKMTAIKIESLGKTQGTQVIIRDLHLEISEG